MALVITRQGFGDVWEIEGEPELHPIYQYGDAILREPSDVPRQYNTLEISRLLDLTGDEVLKRRVLSLVDGHERNSHKEKAFSSFEGDIFSALCGVAKVPPDDSESLIQLVKMDRQTVEEKIMSDKAAADAKAPKAAKYAPDAIITMGKDKEGKPYGKDNNPKRQGSRSYDEFALYKDGMTVAAYEKALGKTVNANLDYDTAKGFVKVG